MNRRVGAMATLVLVATGCSGASDDRASERRTPGTTGSPSASITTPAAPPTPTPSASATPTSSPESPTPAPAPASPTSVVTPVRPGSPGGGAAPATTPQRDAVKRTSAAKGGRLPAPIELDSGAVVELLSSVAAQAEYSASGAEATGGEIGLFTLRLTNPTGSDVDLSSAVVGVAYGTPAREATPVADLQVGYSTGPLSLTLTPGLSTQVDLAFAIPARAGKGMTMTFRPGETQERVTFTDLPLG